LPSQKEWALPEHQQVSYILFILLINSIKPQHLLPVQQTILLLTQ